VVIIPLCDVCGSIDFSALLIIPELDGRRLPQWRQEYHQVDHHATSAALCWAAAEGCELCTLLLDADTRGDKNWESTGRQQISTHELGPFQLSGDYQRGHEIHAAGSEMCTGLVHSSAGFATLPRVLELSLDSGHSSFFPRSRSPNPDFKLWKSWVTTCAESHPACSSLQPVKLPSRLLDLSTHVSDGTLRFVETRGGSGSYVALSHVWGQKQLPLTTAGNYTRNLAGIAVSQLPLTFRDAVIFARGLNYRYLWIDSLCIIQDGERDWQSELLLMESIYSNAALTIAAAGAQDSSMGLYIQQDVHGRNVPAYTLHLTDNEEGSCLTLSVYPGSRDNLAAGELPNQTTLATRAWAMQERLLSARTLGFVASKYYFGCNKVYCDDHVSLPVEPDSVDSAHSLRELLRGSTTNEIAQTDPFKLRIGWQLFLKRYSWCCLTEGRDRLSALSAIAQRLSVTYGRDYAAGIWLGDLAWCLAWGRIVEAGPDPRASKPAMYEAPSWSWASCNRPTLILPYASRT